jgi:hypothetical protein
LPLTSPLNLPAPGRRQCVYGALRGLAHTCVFAKQSLGPIRCDQKERRARSALPSLASLLPKLRDHYAEFLDPVSLVHLRLLASPTCVGLRYGHLIAPHRAFLACRLHKSWHCLAAQPSHQVSAIFEVAYTLGRSSTKPLLLCSSVPLWFNTMRRDGNFNPLTIGYASGASP